MHNTLTAHMRNYARVITIKEGLELVSQQAYSSEKAPLSSDPRTTTDWDPLSNPQRKGKKLVDLLQSLIPTQIQFLLVTACQ
uniref:Uncharacterized protein n=1 Tax=Solanum tuberosum TaxID=4113 RepID=M1BHV5_SOLTU